jgi:hypothetical protein
MAFQIQSEHLMIHLEAKGIENFARVVSPLNASAE